MLFFNHRIWGERIKERLARIELWAEKQGLELAADCHLARLSQAAMLLIAPKVRRNVKCCNYTLQNTDKTLIGVKYIPQYKFS